mmetsp:Transcript_24484/g.52956  ORF Transcript_24484/g.52956 Transcript_24484/m.52956 type:complete len:455 (-) Transcript_24484:234-1598(-)
MISSYYRPSNLPPDISGSPSHEDPSKQSQVSFVSEPDQHASPRSCTNTEIFLDMVLDAASSHIKKQTAAVAAVDQEKTDAVNKEFNKEIIEDDDVVIVMREEETPAEVAMLLTAVADIATKEIKADPPIMSALADAFPRFPDLSSNLSDEGNHYPGIIAPHNGRVADNKEEMMDYEMQVEEPAPAAAAPTLMHFDHKKMRAVSVDLGYHRQEPLKMMSPPPSPPHEEEAIPTLLQWRNLRGETTSPPHQQQLQQGIFSTPPPSPLVSKQRHAAMHMAPNMDYHRRCSRVPSTKGHHQRTRPRAVSMAEGAIEQVPVLDMTAPESGANDKPKTLILRKKFSWKNYPQLEEFLIANREEYLRHSTLNYTMQQKKYNNCLTERMIKLAGEHGYAFDETEFSFVTVRDRIRCYYKSYVQSMKKRGVVIGYAARKAGLVTERELEQSAHTNGKIYVPRN